MSNGRSYTTLVREIGTSWGQARPTPLGVEKNIDHALHHCLKRANATGGGDMIAE